MFPLPRGVTFFERGWLSSNNILIQDDAQALLIDTGYWTHAHQTEALLRQTLGQQALTHILNTHLHSDHCGGNSHLQSVFPSVQTYIPPGHASYVDVWNPEVLTYIPTGQHCPPFSKTHLLHTCDVFVVGRQTWRVHAAPGHDPHSVILFNENEGVLISADALWENGFGVVFPEIEGLRAFDDVASTLHVIEQLKPKLVLPGHGKPFNDVAEALRRARSRLSQFRSAPDKHATYAAKVLLKFKLLELQKSKLSDYLSWAKSTNYLQLLHDAYGDGAGFDAWLMALCRSLEKAGACAVVHDEIFNT
jgi:glyoxylase-like metal-dependent hydrolase (beta-lactamase superfamily II)